MENNITYNRFEINDNLSMGENGFSYYDDILERNAFNRIILSTILNLHKKKYLEVNTNEKNELIINILSNNETLKESEYFVYECLKHIDKDENGIITLDEFNASENTIFAKNKKNIRELIYQEAMKDGLINVEKYKMKRKYFFKTIASALISPPIMAVFLGIILEYIFILIPILYIAYYILKISDLNKIKKSLINSDIMKYSSKKELKNLGIDFSPFIVIFILNYFFLRYSGRIISDGNLSLIIFLVETLILLILPIKYYTKFMKTDIITEKAISLKQNLQNLANFLKEYSLMEDRKSIEIHLWDIYLILSVLLNINKTITQELKFEISNNHKNKEIEKQFDFYENKYFYINDKNEKVYLD